MDDDPIQGAFDPTQAMTDSLHQTGLTEAEAASLARTWPQ